MDFKYISMILMAILYILAGINHFRMPVFYEKIVPPFLPAKFCNVASGIAEIILGIMFFIPSLVPYAAWGIIALLIAIYPANIYHFIKGIRKKKMVTVLAIRLPLQFLLIWWAYVYT